jgi:tellurite resistance protein TehA-like permease
MTPIWIFPAYPLLLMGPIAANLIDALPDSGAAARINSIAMALGAVCIQGTGFLVSLMIYSAFIYRLMTQKLPRETARPGMVRLFLTLRLSLVFDTLADYHSSSLSGLPASQSQVSSISATLSFRKSCQAGT